ncbi:30S ribosomal protein S19e [Methanoregula formicica]|uniref:Small ribosomal subunit protein eS19 n=1 Tax=Methanoregula formicica (strain DSM 22288 / NBRC 105244 / SMSP) TaxID=593750 RepID=L0HEC6_METFS|nr:30S ribosomal protein S19e [Methanoregula formicica]AGB02136.1 ribosomal protein S19E (S16A) [Methanoregula formicica SMSP]
MTTVYDVPADHIIRRVAEELKKRKEIVPPAWAAFAKTGVHKEMPPEDPDWWFTRAAAVLRRVYVDGPLGVERMRSFYGGKKNRGSKPNAFRKGSGSILRKSLQQLEAAGLVIHDKTGRRVSPEGMKFMDNLSADVLKNPPAPVPKRVKPVAEEPKKAEGKKGKPKGEKAAAADGAEGGKAEKKPAKKKADKAEAPQ